MSTEAILVNDPGQVSITAATTYTSGEIIQAPGGMAAVVGGMKAAASGDPVTFITEGVFDVLTLTATTFAAGAPVYWDASAGVAIASPAAADDLYLGVAVKACTNAQDRVRVNFNRGNAGAGATGQRACFATRAQVMDWEDTAEHILVAAAENVNGLVVKSFYGIVTEVMAGGTQDQLIVTLYDEDDNVLSVATPTDAGANALGALIPGTLTLDTGILDSALAVIPAGKAAYAKVSQATSGTSAAGAVRVQAIVAPLL